MAGATKNNYVPDYAVHPGAILEETLEARGMKKATFAKQCGLSDKTVSQIINGKTSFSPETAIQFERVLGVSATLWNNLDAFYRLHTAQISARQKLKKQVSWAKKFPIAKLVNRGHIEKPSNEIDAVEKVLNFFAVGSHDAWKKHFKEMSVSYRHSPSFKSVPESVAMWLRLGERYAEGIDTKPFSKERLNANLKKIRLLTTKPPDVFEPKIIKLCAEAGIALVFVSELPGTHLSGATRWLSKDKALIILSLRHKSDDHFWFSFFHETAHLLLHGKRKVYLDEAGMDYSEEEQEADSFASNMLIPKQDYMLFVENGKFAKNDIVVFAEKIKIAPGIIVGRLQHDRKIDHSWHNSLKRRFKLLERK